MLAREEYIEQAYFYRTLSERLPKNMPLQELLRQVKEEMLASTKLPMAIDFLRAELEHTGGFGSAMSRLPHYFTSFQTYLVKEAENERGQFDLRVALEILRVEVEYRSEQTSRQGLFMFQFEVLCRNRLRYDRGLEAMAADPIYDQEWRNWILKVRHDVGLIDFPDLIYVSSELFQKHRRARAGASSPHQGPTLFGEKEGKIALSNRGKDPLYLFAALQRHLTYPAVPRLQPRDDTAQILPQVLRRMERLETRMKLIEQEQRGGIDITKFYRPDGSQPGS